MTSLVTADLHLSDKPRDLYRFQFLEVALPKLIKDESADNLIILGDLTEAKDSHRATLVNRIVDNFAELASSVNIYFLKGNHDYVKEDTPFYRFLQHLPAIRWINEPTKLICRGLGECIFLPHTTNIDDWNDYLKPKRKADLRWYFCHQAFDGANIGHGRKIEGTKAQFPKGSIVISGDIHIPQECGRVKYVGAPYTIDFGDEYKPRALAIGVRAKSYALKSISLSGPGKRFVEISDPSDLEKDFGLERGDIVKVRLTVEGEIDNPDTSQFREAVRAWGMEGGLNVAAVQIVTPKSEWSDRRRDVRTDEELAREYVKKMRKGKATLRTGLRLMKEAQ